MNFDKEITEEKIKEIAEFSKYLSDFPHHVKSVAYGATEMAKWKDEQLPTIMLKYTLWMNNRGFFSEDLCVDFEHQIKTFLEQIYPQMEDHETEIQEEQMSIPKTLEEAIVALDNMLEEEDKQFLLKHGALSVHHSLGMWIRNNFGLWEDSELKKNLIKEGFFHPDDMSNFIIEEYITHLKLK